MNDIATIGLEFAQKCLGWECPITVIDGVLYKDGVKIDPGNFESIWPFIRIFLDGPDGTQLRYCIQMNRDRATNARWRVAIGVQDVARRGASRDNVEVFDDNQTRALMAACVLAAEKLQLGGV